MGYDLIGDIHGHAKTLTALLSKLGYSEKNGAWGHPERKVIFLGDFIDRGPHQEEVINIVRPMIESGNALAVMGNHEFNAISFYSSKPGGGHMRERSWKNIKQHLAFLHSYGDLPSEWAEVIDWFKTLPLWLDLDGLRIVHACWDPKFIKKIEDFQNGSCYLGDDLLRAANDRNTWQYKAIETLLKGKEIDLPNGSIFHDKEGTPRKEIRIRWWDRLGTTYRSAFLGSETAVTHIPDDPIPGEHLVEYSHSDNPVFIGHYWLEGTPLPLAPNIACLDYSVARNKGKLVAYRWDGEQILNPDKFITTNRQENERVDQQIPNPSMIGRQ